MNYEKIKLGGASRSPRWTSVRKAFLGKKACAVCGGKKSLTVHHVLPFHLFPKDELNYENLIVLCENPKGLNCHLILGHWGNFGSKYNKNIRKDALLWNKRLVQ